jgi:hypothetical protein
MAHRREAAGSSARRLSVSSMRRHIAFVALAALSFTACADSPPPIGRELPAVFAEARPVFDKRVRQRFPVGSEEAKLLAELHSEAFTLKEASDPSTRYRYSATYTAHKLVCNLSWTVSWNSEKGKITDIAGDYGATCL